MSTRMTSKVEALESRVTAIDSSLRNQEVFLRNQEVTVMSHDATLKEHTSMLADITQTLAMLHTEVREGFQQQQRRDKGKDKEESDRGASSGVSFIISGDGNKQMNGRRLEITESQTEDLRLMAKRIELLPFCGDDPYGWVSRAEMYFAVQGTPPNLQIQLTQICMEGMPWHWFKMLKKEDPNLDWEKFKSALFDRYGNQQSGNLFLQLKMLRQVGSVDEFVEEFEMLASQVSGITDEQYMGLFMGGLKEDIRLEVQTLEPQNRYKAVSMARNVERKLIRTGVLKAPVRKQGNFMSTHLQGNYLVNGGKYYGAPMTRTI